MNAAPGSVVLAIPGLELTGDIEKERRGFYPAPPHWVEYLDEVGRRIHVESALTVEHNPEPIDFEGLMHFLVGKVDIGFRLIAVHKTDFERGNPGIIYLMEGKQSLPTNAEEAVKLRPYAATTVMEVISGRRASAVTLLNLRS